MSNSVSGKIVELSEAISARAGLPTAPLASVSDEAFSAGPPTIYVDVVRGNLTCVTLMPRKVAIAVISCLDDARAEQIRGGIVKVVVSEEAARWIGAPDGFKKWDGWSGESK